MKKMSCLTWSTPIFILLIGLHLTSVRSVSVYDEPPSIVAHPTTRYGDKRLPLVLKCRATGTPEPTYYWKKNGVLIDVNTNDRASLDGGNLVIDPLEDEDNGVYQCFASNRLGTAMSKKITTAVAYVDEFVDIMPSTFTVRVGEPMSLRCGIEHGPPGGYPDPLFYWTDDSPKPSPIVYDPRINKDQEGTLVFSNVIASDAKSYYCRAINTVVGVSRRSPKITLIVQTGFGSPDESLAKLVAHPPPNAVALRTEDYSMKCIATGYPTPEITWKRGDEQLWSGGRVSIDETGQGLVISAVEYGDRGIYTCVAVNDVGTDDFSSILSVESAPYFPAPPSDETKLPGESVSIECRADGVPPPTVDVLVNGEPWAEFQSSIDTTRWTVVTGNKKLATISIVDLQTTDSNVFQCIATNKYREELTNVVLNILAIPARITSLTPQTITVFKNGSATFTCHVEGKPIPVITWTFKGSDLTDGDKYNIDGDEGRLVITSVKGADSGVYECKASNDIYGLEYSERDEAYLTVLENFAVRLADTERSANEGRVEISYDGIWGTVCSNRWDIVDADVVCKEMGFTGALEVGNATTYGEGSGPIWMDNVNCSGTEVTLNDCRHSGPRTSGCNHSNDVGVVCSTPAKPPTVTTPAHDSLGAGGIAGIAVCFGILVVIAILLVVVRCKQRQTKSRTMKKKTEPRPTAL